MSDPLEEMSKVLAIEEYDLEEVANGLYGVYCNLVELTITEAYMTGDALSPLAYQLRLLTMAAYRLAHGSDDDGRPVDGEA